MRKRSDQPSRFQPRAWAARSAAAPSGAPAMPLVDGVEHGRRQAAAIHPGRAGRALGQHRHFPAPAVAAGQAGRRVHDETAAIAAVLGQETDADAYPSRGSGTGQLRSSAPRRDGLARPARPRPRSAMPAPLLPATGASRSRPPGRLPPAPRPPRSSGAASRRGLSSGAGGSGTVARRAHHVELHDFGAARRAMRVRVATAVAPARDDAVATRERRARSWATRAAIAGSARSARSTAARAGSANSPLTNAIKSSSENFMAVARK